MLIAHEGGTVRTSLDPHTGPGVELIGDLIDEHGRMGHGPIVRQNALDVRGRRW
jgi:hypothetical protein